MLCIAALTVAQCEGELMGSSRLERDQPRPETCVRALPADVDGAGVAVTGGSL